MNYRMPVQASISKQEINMKFSFSNPVPEVLYQDEDILVVIKPAGMPSLPDKLGFMDLQTFLQASFGRTKSLPDTSIKIIHKLDRPVGGVTIFSRSETADKWFDSEIPDRKIQKTYEAIVCGTVPSPKGELIDYLVKSEKTNRSRVVPKERKGSKRAALGYEVLQSGNVEGFGDISLLRLTLFSGRHHQIRVQLSNAGCPIFGDGKYNKLFSSAKNKGWYKLALFSSEIFFIHPRTGKEMTFRADPFAREPLAFSTFFPKSPEALTD